MSTRANLFFLQPSLPREIQGRRRQIFEQQPHGHHGQVHPHDHAPARPPTHKTDRAEHVAFVCPIHLEVRSPNPAPARNVAWRWNPPPSHRRQHASNTLPMHPEIVRPEPGSCPICGMALEPRTLFWRIQPNPELVDMTRRFWVSAALSLPLFILAMSDMLQANLCSSWCLRVYSRGFSSSSPRRWCCGAGNSSWSAARNPS